MSHGPDHTHSGGGKQEVDLYPAGAAYASHHHSHVIVSQRVLVTVLGLLLLFTAMTVGAAKAEEWASETFHVVIPQWVNVFVALSIAAVKTVIVAAYFMQLRYDNPMNSAVAVFTVFVLASFFGFTMIDLGNRSILYDWKGVQIVAGGTGKVLDLDISVAENARVKARATLAQMVKDIETRTPGAKPIPEFLHHFAEEELARQKADMLIISDKVAKRATPPDEYLVKAIEIYEAANKGAVAATGHGHGEHGADGNTANRTRVRTGITLTELGATGHEGHAGTEHGGEHKDEAKPAGETKEPAKPAEHGK